MREIGPKLVEQDGEEMNTKLHAMSTRHFIEKSPPIVNKKRLTRACKVCSDKTKVQTGKTI